jgi:hypothetical protein
MAGLSGLVAAGAQEGLAEALARQMIEAQRLEQQRQFTERLNLDREQFNEQMRATSERERRQTRIDEETATDRGEARRIEGLRSTARQNVADIAANTRDPEQARRQAAIFAAHGELPEAPDMAAELLKPQVPEPLTTKTVNVGGRPVIQGLTRAQLQDGEFEEYREPERGPQATPEWVKDAQGNIVKRVPQRGDTPYDAVAARGEARAEKPSTYAIDSANKIVSKVDALLPRIDSLTAGVLGKGLSQMPWNTEARDVAADLESLTASIGFDELQKMRAASPTGGALGQISDRENALLANVVASVRQDQSPANLKRNLQAVRESAARIQAAAQKDAGTSSAVGDMRPMTSRGTPTQAPASSKFTIVGVK